MLLLERFTELMATRNEACFMPIRIISFGGEFLEKCTFMLNGIFTK